MSLLRFAVRGVAVALFISWGLLCVTLIFPWVAPHVRAAMNGRWSRGLMKVCGVHIRVRGEPRKAGAVLWVANHVSWVDIFVLNSVRPTSFIAKSDIRAWPIIGWLVAGAGTVFIERGHRHAIRKVGHQMKAQFSRGAAVGLFPEGTTTPGFDVSPFHTSLFEAAISAQVDIQPVALRFFHKGRRSDYVAFVGEQNLVQNLWRLLGTTDVAVELVFLPAMASQRCAEEGRGKTAAHAHHAIRQAVVEKHS